MSVPALFLPWYPTGWLGAVGKAWHHGKGFGCLFMVGAVVRVSGPLSGRLRAGILGVLRSPQSSHIRAAKAGEHRQATPSSRPSLPQVCQILPRLSRGGIPQPDESLWDPH